MEQTRLENYEAHLKERSKFHLGYPYNLSNIFPDKLTSFLKYSINNLGDPFVDSNYGIHSRTFEIETLNWFADLWSIDKDNFWGYVGSSGTEGNFSGLLIARDNYPDAILYASEESHYSVFKAAHMYRMKYEKVNSNFDGTINLDHLKECLDANPNNRTVILSLNIGTTMKGGIDDVDGVIELLKARNLKFYIHCDGALSGMLMRDNYISFKKEIHSVSVSGHKFLGCPFPCGVIITRKNLVQKLAISIEYIGSLDTTIMGSRNGHSILFMWYILQKKTKADFLKEYDICVANAKHVEKETQKSNTNLFILRNGNTVVLKRPPCEEFVKKWQLACSKDMCHVVVMPNITLDVLNTFVEEYKLLLEK
jgi:histidine decarboxylase